MTQTLAATLLGFFAVGYIVLGGADIGVGMMLPFLGRDGDRRRLVLAAIVPFFLAHEVWLVATAGLLIGAFPALEAQLFPGLFPLIVALVTGWIVRDMGLWSRERAGGRAWPAICDTAVTLGSWTVAGAWAWILAGLLTGVTDGVATGPGVVVIGAVVVVLFAVHGLAFAGLRLPGRTGGRARFALTAAVLAAVLLAAGARLEFTAAAADDATLRLLVPAVAATLPLLLIGQVVTWRLFRHRVSGGVTGRVTGPAAAGQGRTVLPG